MLGFFILGVAILIALPLVSRWYVSCDPKALVKALKWVLFSVALVVVLWLLLSGKLVAALVALPAVLVWFVRLFSGLRAAKGFAGAMGGDYGPAGSPSGAMTRQEALQVLGLTEGASPEAIKAAHRHLMAQVHPDVGGTDYLAQQINQARAILLGK